MLMLGKTFDFQYSLYDPFLWLQVVQLHQQGFLIEILIDKDLKEIFSWRPTCDGLEENYDLFYT